MSDAITNQNKNSVLYTNVITDLLQIRTLLSRAEETRCCIVSSAGPSSIRIRFISGCFH